MNGLDCSPTSTDMVVRDHKKLKIYPQRNR